VRMCGPRISPGPGRRRGARRGGSSARATGRQARRRKEPIKPMAGRPNSVGPPLTVITIDEPTISAATTSAIATRLAARSIWSPTRLRCASSSLGMPATQSCTLTRPPVCCQCTSGISTKGSAARLALVRCGASPARCAGVPSDPARAGCCTQCRSAGPARAGRWPDRQLDARSRRLRSAPRWPPGRRATAGRAQWPSLTCSSVTASGLTSDDRSPGLSPLNTERTTRRMIFMLRVFGRSLTSSTWRGR